MRLSTRAAMLSAGVLWGGCMLCLGLLNLMAPPYGSDFLHLIASIYPGYHPSGTLSDALVGAVYGLADGAVGGLLLAWMYNIFVGRTVAGHSGT